MDTQSELRELADRLIALPDDSFAEKYELQKRMDALKADIPAFDKDAGRSRSDLEAELAERHRQYELIMRTSGLATTPMSDGAGGAGDAAHGAFRDDVHSGMGLEAVDRRIGEINAALERLEAEPEAD